MKIGKEKILCTPIPDCMPSYYEVSKQLRINVECIKKEITLHVDMELERFKKYLKEYKKEME